MGAFDNNDVYIANPYNGEQRMQSVTWIVITAIVGCVFIAKRLYFKREKEILKKGDPQTDFKDILTNTMLFLVLCIFLFGPPNPNMMYILFTILMIGLIIGVIYFFNTLQKFKLSDIGKYASNMKDLMKRK